ncbi:hypothetical protein GCM10007860_31150 [Chitiniphilus shinanonensis]|uniref:Uncharacterized protein n=1 Tax=Chitiniphilus shinanonensis TaxID=553088 RepID=A0ABQ6BZJ0_9NEIS|nr:hypothetical protein GCM10007860_31150 [Chitiniphilus shinanonensis]
MSAHSHKRFSGALLSAAAVAPYSQAMKGREGESMVHYAVAFLLIAAVAGAFGYGGIAAGAEPVARLACLLLLAAALAVLLAGGWS